MSIGLFILGHGQLASGFLSALKELQAHADDVLYLDFDPETEESLFEKKMDELLENQKGEMLFLVDLPGTIPYRLACKKAGTNRKVLSGLNLGMLMEANAMRQFTEDLDQLAQDLVVAGQNQIVNYESQTSHK